MTRVRITIALDLETATISPQQGPNGVPKTCEVAHRRWWWWVATMPRTYFDPVFKCETTVTFDPKLGRLYQPEDLTKHLLEP